MHKQNTGIVPGSLLTEHDVYLFKQGNHFKLYEKLGARIGQLDGTEGTFFAVWAPNAQRVSVIGDFNGWNRDSHPLTVRYDESGIWEGFIPGLAEGSLYKFHIDSQYANYTVDKGDPFAYWWEIAPKTASIVCNLDYDWNDSEWMKNRRQFNWAGSPMSVYEVHLGSWRRDPADRERLLNYREIAHELADYVKKMGFSHVELLPIMEHPFYGSWGYQTVGYFAPASRYGTCQDFMYLVDHLHQKGIGVLLDWVPSHFPSDEHGLAYFDGTHLFEHADKRLGFHPEWKSYIFNYGRNEVRSFLISNATFWLEKYHIDGLRVDAVASMLYLDYSREPGEWIPNIKGGRENLEAISFLRTFNEWVHSEYPDVVTIAEESTSWPRVSGAVSDGGLGFSMKWNMGWMHDSLEYFSTDSIYRKHHQDKLTFSIWYAFSEKFMLALSHDEVVYGKGSLLGKMAGDEWQQFANLRVLLGYMYTHPGKKLMFMGADLAQRREWNHDSSLDWHLLDEPRNAALNRYIQDLNRMYKEQPGLHEIDFAPEGFEWIDFHDAERSIVSYLRRSRSYNAECCVVCNLTPVSRYNYRVGVPTDGIWKEILNSDAAEYGGSGQGNMGGVEASPASYYGRYDYSLSLTLPPLSLLVFRREADE